jgi:DNA polymerase
MKLSRELLALLETCACHRNPHKWALMYRIVWRAQHGERHVLQLAADRDVRELQAMARAIHHDCHKMHAFVRFREAAGEDGVPRYIAWFEPQHLILRRVAPFFVDRFASMHWSIVTPDGAVQWDRQSLRFLDEADAPALPVMTTKRSCGAPTTPASSIPHASIHEPPRSICEAVLAQSSRGRGHRSAGRRSARARICHAENAAQRQRAVGTRGAGTRVAVDPETLPGAIARCTRCPLWEHATQAVCGFDHCQRR